jgi:hypothetical protein
MLVKRVTLEITEQKVSRENQVILQKTKFKYYVTAKCDVISLQESVQVLLRSLKDIREKEAYRATKVSKEPRVEMVLKDRRVNLVIKYVLFCKSKTKIKRMTL